MTRQSHHIPLRPIDAIFIHPERRIYVVYYRGELWQLPRMKIDEASWQRRRPYQGPTETLYLSRRQSIDDPILGKILRTLNLPVSVRGITLARFEEWWSIHGFEWLKGALETGQSPLAVHSELLTAKNREDSSTIATHSESTFSNDSYAGQSSSAPNISMSNESKKHNSIQSTLNTATDIFASMLADLTDEVLNS